MPASPLPDQTIFGLTLPVLAAISSAVLALVSAIAGPLVQLIVGRRQTAAAQSSADASMHSAKAAMAMVSHTGLQTIALFREKWIISLRDTLSDYHAILMSEEYPYSLEVRRKISELGTRIDLLLDPSDTLSNELIAVSDRILDLENIDDRMNLDRDLVEAARKVLKAEWHRLREELRGIPPEKKL